MWEDGYNSNYSPGWRTMGAQGRKDKEISPRQSHVWVRGKRVGRIAGRGKGLCEHPGVRGVW